MILKYVRASWCAGRYKAEYPKQQPSYLITMLAKRLNLRSVLFRHCGIPGGLCEVADR